MRIIVIVNIIMLKATVGGGGWPMSVWLTPDLKPIVGGTYFPPEDHHYGQPGFLTILQHVLTKVRACKVHVLPKKPIFLLSMWA